eukprot:c25774_g1_i1.p1 GENE.c25774_g1_i1~~c25774_g1_i1.p1  ORF type:complete len:603 (+),score=163.24 c25774_g1_i1:48-1856(+)
MLWAGWCLVLGTLLVAAAPAIPHSQAKSVAKFGEPELRIEPVDYQGEIVNAQGTATVMTQDGLGHMVGSNDKISVQTKKAPLSLAANERDSKISELKGMIEMVAKENLEAQAKISKLQGEPAQLKSIKDYYAEQVKAVERENDEHLDSIKRESAIGVKRVRSDEDSKIASIEETTQKTKQTLESEMTAKLNELKEKSTLAEKRLHDSDAEAEKIYQKHRAQWRAKHEAELALHGVKGQLDTIQQDLAREKARMEMEQKTVSNLKTQFKEEARGRVLATARLKLLSAKEVTLKEREQALEKTNADLQHSIHEMKFTQLEGAADANAARDGVRKSAVQAAEQARAEMQLREQEFQKTTLQHAQEEIERLKSELRADARNEARAERDVVAQENNVIAEHKEAEEALARANWLLEKAHKQVAVEMDATRQAERTNIDEARRTASKIREEMRAKGMEKGQAASERMLSDMKHESEELHKKLDETAHMTEEFEHHMKEKLDLEKKQAQDLINKREREMQSEIRSSVERDVDEEKQRQRKAVEDAHNAAVAAMERSVKLEQVIDTKQHEHDQLQQELASLEAAEQHQKQQWTEQEINAVPARGPLPNIL